MNTNTLQVNGPTEFEAVALQSDRPVAVDFWAEWCGPCKAMGPALEEAAEQLEGQAHIAKVNIDEEANRELASRYSIQSIPTVLYFKNGELKDRSVGLIGKEDIVNRLVALN